MNLGPSNALVGSQMPIQLQSTINPAQWDAICHKFRKANEDAMLMSCGGEIGACLCLGFFCVFLCHPCIFHLVKRQTLEEACRYVNRTYFSGRNAFHNIEDNIYFNPETVQSNYSSQPQIATAVLVQPFAQNVHMMQPYDAPSALVSQQPNYLPDIQVRSLQQPYHQVQMGTIVTPVTSPQQYYEISK
jgi:hypothetical protein